MAEHVPGIELLSLVADPDPQIIADAIDTTSADSWASAYVAMKDLEFAITGMAVAFDAGVFSLKRYLGKTPPLAKDLPIGAAVCVPGKIDRFYPGFSQDKELDDPDAHAEIMAIRYTEMVGGESELDGSTLTTTVEPCPSCLTAIDKTGITRVMYGTSRRDLEAIRIVKPHDQKATDIVSSRRQENDDHHFELVQLPIRAIGLVCLELFSGISRDLETGEVQFDPEVAKATRWRHFDLLMRDAYINERQTRTESEILFDSFYQTMRTA